VDALRPEGLLLVVTTLSVVAERAWWGRMLPHGARINDHVGAHPSLRELVREKADWYVISLFERKP